MAGPDTKNIDACRRQFRAMDRTASEPDTKNLDALLASLNTSAERFQTLWFSFLGLTLYLAIAALTTTHTDATAGRAAERCRSSTSRCQLLPFYVIAPLLYLVFHFYLLDDAALLARTAAEFENQVAADAAGGRTAERYRARVENALFLQLLVGMKGERAGFNGFLLGLYRAHHHRDRAARDARPHADDVPALPPFGDQLVA